MENAILFSTFASPFSSSDAVKWRRSMSDWRYFGRQDDFGKVFEIYRIPANGKRFDEQKKSDVERLQRDGSWRYHESFRDGIWREVFLGGFSESDDELTEGEVDEYF